MPTTCGSAECILCGAPVTIKLTDKNKPYYNCAPEGDGGCNVQVFARGPASSRKLVDRVKKWSDPELRKAWKGQDLEAVNDDEPVEVVEPARKAVRKVAPKPAPKAVVKPAPANRDTPVPANDDRGFWDKEIL